MVGEARETECGICNTAPGDSVVLQLLHSGEPFAPTQSTKEKERDLRFEEHFDKRRP